MSATRRVAKICASRWWRLRMVATVPRLPPVICPDLYLTVAKTESITLSSGFTYSLLDGAEVLFKSIVHLGRGCAPPSFTMPS